MPDEVIPPPAGQAAPPATPPAIFGETPGQFAPEWFRHVPGMEEYAATAANFTDLPNVFKSLRHATAMASGKAGIKPLAADANEEQRTAWDAEVRKLLGVPDKGDIEAYALKPAELPPGTQWNEARAQKLAEAAHAHGMTPKQAAAMQGLYLAIQEEETAAEAERYKAGFEKEQADLKAAFGDKLNSTINSAQRAALALNIPADVLDPQSPNFMALSSTQLIQTFAKLSEALGESRLPSANAVQHLSPQDQAADIINNPANPLHAAFHRGDQNANATVDRLLAQKS